MKKLLFLIVIMTLMSVILATTAQAQNWIDYGNKTRVGAVYAATCNVCNEYGRYNNDTANLWQCTNDGNTNPYYRDCKQALIDAVLGRYKGV